MGVAARPRSALALLVMEAGILVLRLSALALLALPFGVAAYLLLLR